MVLLVLREKELLPKPESHFTSITLQPTLLIRLEAKGEGRKNREEKTQD